MQSTKDTFYAALRDRLHQHYPSRTITINGAARPAVIVAENVPAPLTTDPLDCFVLRFGAPTFVHAIGPNQALYRMSCTITYATAGSDAACADRGRSIAEFDNQLIALTWPRNTPKLDYSSASPVPLGTNVFWGVPHLCDTKQSGDVLQRAAIVMVHFYSEVSS